MAEENIRKQVYLLSSQDFLDHPIWEFCSDEEDVEGQDEATVKPSDAGEVLGYSPGAYLVAADITYANGTSAKGYVYSSPPDDLGCLQPNILLSTGQINLWLGSLQFLPEWKEVLTGKINLLGGDAGFFPMSFETKANVNGTRLKVVVQGFLARGLDRRVVKFSSTGEPQPLL